MPPDGRDLEIIARANRGDIAALDELYERYRPWVLRLAARMLGDREAAADVVQDTFLRVCERFPGFELTVAMTTYLHTVVERLCRDRLVRVRPTVDIDDTNLSGDNLHARAEASDLDAAEMLARLPADQRELLTLRFVDDMSLPQLSETLGAPLGTIKSRLSRATAALRELVEEPAVKRRPIAQ
jgi:RNA polymerase sigma-70 factor, ECF subfamily